MIQSPPGWNQFVVVAINVRNGSEIHRTYVRANSKSEAVKIGKSALKMIGIKGKFKVGIMPYKPWEDYHMRGFVQVNEQDK